MGSMTDYGDCTDPGGVPFAQLDPALLRNERTSIKWARFPEDVLPLFVAEMDFAVAPVIREKLIERVQASDIGYVQGIEPAASSFAGFARDRWGWEIPRERIHLATDVATGVVEALRIARPAGGRLALSTPTYPGFFEMLEEVPFETVQIPLAQGVETDRAPRASGASAAVVSDAPVASDRCAANWGLDLAAIEREFASERGIDAFILCNPHNPHGIAFTSAELTRLAELAAHYDVFVVSDEIHAPLTHAGVAFTPFAPLAARAGALSVTTTSASKGWNLAGAKCSVIVAADDRANALLVRLPSEVQTRVSLLGLHANATAFANARDWLDRAVAQAEANSDLLAELVRDHLPGVVFVRPHAGYLAWLDFRGSALTEDPYTAILRDAKVALNNGHHFGEGGAGHVRLNLACAPDTLREAIRRIAEILPEEAR